MISSPVRNRPGLLILLLAVISTIPLWLPAIPPLTDLLGHLGRYRVQLDLASNASLQRYYAFEWALIPNLGVDLLVQLLAPLFGLEHAVKSIVIGIVGLTVGGLLMLSYQAHGRIGAAALFALPLAYAFPFQFGFVNYCLSMALAVNALALWMRLSALRRLALRAWIFMPISFVIWLSHISGWGAFGLFVFAAEIIRRRDDHIAGSKPTSWPHAIGASILSCAPLALPLIIMAVTDRVGSGGSTAHWFNWQIKYQWFAMALSEHWQPFDIISVTILLFLIAATAILSDLRFNRSLGLAALLLFAAFIVTPRILIGSAYADMRLAPFVLAIAVLAIDTQPAKTPMLRRWLLLAGFVFFIARTGATTQNFHYQSLAIQGELGALNHIPDGARLASFVTYECRARWRLERRTHLPSIALARKHVFTNDQFIMAGAQLIQVTYKGGFPFDRDPTQLVKPPKCSRPDLLTLEDSLKRLPRDGFDFVWLIGTPKGATVDRNGLRLVWQRGESALYQIMHDSPNSGE